MHELTYLKDLVVILSVAVVVVIVFHRLKLPPIAGFILSGVLLGPRGLALINEIDQVELLAEIGVALLLFGIGVELTLNKLRRIWKLAVAGGLLQMGLTWVAVFFICRIAGLSAGSATFIGFIISISSTAVVLSGLQLRGEVDAPHGRLILGILVFQDFSVVPIMLLIPLLAGTELSAGSFAVTLAKSLGIVCVVLLLAILIVPRILKLVALTRQRQLFILAVFVICLGTAWLVTMSGTSLAIGAFLAGLVVSGSEYRQQALADLISFREVFASLFFVAVGMLLAPIVIIGNLGTIMVILAAILLGKSLIVFVTAAVLRMPLRLCLMAALALAQIGEFSFILIHATKETGLISESIENSLVAAAILSMFITPFAMSYSPRLAMGLSRLAPFRRITGIDSIEARSDTIKNLRDHVIIAGYGFAGRELSLVLQKHKIPFVIADINIENVRKASRETGKAVFGDVTSEWVLSQLGVDSARELMLLINDPGATALAVRVARRLAPKLFITVRTFYLFDIDPMLAAGADEVIPAEREAAVQVVSRMLKRHQIDAHQIASHATKIRDHSENNNA